MYRYAVAAALGLSLSTLLAACGGGGGASSGVGATIPQTPPGSSNPTPPPPPVIPPLSGDPTGLAGNQSLLQQLYADAGLSSEYVASAARAPQSLSPQSSAVFAAQVAAGTSTIARPNNAANASTGFLMTYRDAAGSCECNFNGNQTAPNPPAATMSATGWNNGAAYKTVGSATVVLLPFSGPNLPLPSAGPYTYTVSAWLNDPTAVSATSGFINPSLALPRAATPTIVENKDSSGHLQSISVSWAPVTGATQYFLNFLTNVTANGTKVPTHVAGVVITPGTSITIAASGNLYTNTVYQVLLIASDQSWLNGVLLSTAQSPALPAQVDWSVSQLASFQTP
ncbi:hypothetical protein EPN52_15050 [bacterium]|nr:MAG: hypothetical protein EPN52_15050 [bacterium]